MKHQSPFRPPTRRQFLRMAALGVGTTVLNACAGLPGLAPTATPIVFGELDTPVPLTPGTQAATSTAQPLAKPKIRFEYWDRSVRPVIDAFMLKNPDIDVVMPVGQIDNIQTSNLGSLDLEDSAPDLCVVTRGFLPQFFASNQLYDLGTGSFNAVELGKDMLPAAWKAGALNGTQYAIPWLGNPTALAYRADVLAANEFESEPQALQQQLQRWDDFIDLGIALKTKQAGLTLLADASALFWMALAQRTEPLVGADGTVNLARLTTRPAQLAARARAEGIDANLEQNATAFAEFRKGNILSLFVTPGFEQFIKAELPESVGSWRLAVPPEGPGDLGTTFLVIPKHSRHPEAAWQLITFLTATTDGQNAALLAGSGLPLYQPAWSDPRYEKGHPVYGDQLIWRFWTDMVKQVPDMYISPYDAAASEFLEVELYQVLFNNKNPELAMADAEKKLVQKIQG